MVAVLQQALTGQRVDVTDGLVPTKRFRLTPAGTDRVPIVIAAIQPRMLRLAAEVADVVYLAFCPESEIARHVAMVRDAEAAAGRERGSVAIALTVNSYAGPDVERVDRRMRKFLLHYAGLPTHGPTFVSLADQVSEAIALDRAGEQDKAIDAIGPDVVSQICAIGSPDSVMDRVERMWDLGADQVTLHTLTADRGDVLAPMATLQEVAHARRVRTV